MGVDILQRLLVLAVFVAGVVEEGLDDLAGLILPAVPAGDVSSGQAALLHFALCPAQVAGAVQIPRLAALAGVPILPAGPAVRAAAADLLCAVHGKDLFSVICRGLHQRGQRFQDDSAQPAGEAALPDALPGHHAALAPRVLEILLDLGDAGDVPQIGRALKVVVEAAVVQVDGAHHRLGVVADEDLGVHESGGVLPDLDPGVQKRRVMGEGEGIREGFVRDARQDQPHVHAPLGRKGQGGLELAVEDQIRGHDVHVSLRPVQDVDVHLLPHMVGVHGTVPVGDDEALRLGRGGCRDLRHDGEVRRLFIQVPHLQEHQGEAAGGLALQHDGRVLPVTVFDNAVDVLVLKIHPAGESGAAVDHQDLPVVPVVVVGGDERRNGGEGLAADAQLPQPLRVVAGKRGQLAGPVVHHPHVHPLGRFAGQDLQDAAPHEALVHNEILQENEPLRLFQLPQQLLELLLAQGEVGHSRVLVDREGAAPVQVAGERRGAGGLLFQPLQGPGGGGEQVLGLLHHVGGPVPQGAVAQVALGEQVHQGTEHRQERDDQKPGELCRGVQPAVQQIQHHGHGKEDRASENVGEEISEPAEHAEQGQHLQRQQHDDRRPAEHDGQDAFPPGFQQREPLVLLRRFLRIHSLITPLYPAPNIVCPTNPAERLSAALLLRELDVRQDQLQAQQYDVGGEFFKRVEQEGQRQHDPDRRFRGQEKRRLVLVHPPQRLVDGPGGFPQADDPPDHAHQPHGLGARAQKCDAHDRQDDVRADPLGLVLQKALVPQVRRAVHDPRDQHDAAQQEGQYARHMGGKENAQCAHEQKRGRRDPADLFHGIPLLLWDGRARDISCPRRPAKIERCPTSSIATNRCFVIRFRSGGGKESGRLPASGAVGKWQMVVRSLVDLIKRCGIHKTRKSDHQSCGIVPLKFVSRVIAPSFASLYQR